LIVTAIAITAISVCCYVPVLRAAGRALIVNEAVSRSDVVAVPQWTGAPGVLEAADLIREGLAPRVAVLEDRPTAAQLELKRRGLPDYSLTLVNLLKSLNVSQIDQVVGSGNGTTFDSRLLAEWCAENQVRSVIVVTTPEHSKRLQRLLRRSLKSGSTTTTVRVSRYSDFDADHWWQSRQGVRDSLQEIPKLLLDVLLHPFS